MAMTARRAFASLISAKVRNNFVAPKVLMRVKTSGSSPFEWPLWGKKKLGSTPSASAIFASRLEPTRKP